MSEIDINEVRAYFAKHDTFSAHMGIELVEINEECGVASMPLNPEQRNGMGNGHGGAIFALADMAFAAATYGSGTFYVNAQSSISYLEPGRIGPLRGEARKVRRGKRLATYEVRITDADGTLVAIATIVGASTGIPVTKVAG